MQRSTTWFDLYHKDNARVSTVSGTWTSSLCKHTIGKMLAADNPPSCGRRIVKNGLSIQDCNRKAAGDVRLPAELSRPSRRPADGRRDSGSRDLPGQEARPARRCSRWRERSASAGTRRLATSTTWCSTSQLTDDPCWSDWLSVPATRSQRSTERIREFEVNADQPVADVFHHALEFVSSPRRSSAPRNPRVILIGPRRAAAGTPRRPCWRPKGMPVPDAILLKLLKERLCQLDCVTARLGAARLPAHPGQAEQLADAGFQPNRPKSQPTPPPDNSTFREELRDFLRLEVALRWMVNCDQDVETVFRDAGEPHRESR
uniref:DUF4378 domain-containing protein n=1 Tax=Macrostomum lignano TaxID=282301 RepID=A0A1I8FGF6_9PLAT